jgi:hypothetical protein
MTTGLHHDQNWLFLVLPRRLRESGRHLETAYAERPQASPMANFKAEDFFLGRGTDADS